MVKLEPSELTRHQWSFTVLALRALDARSGRLPGNKIKPLLASVRLYDEVVGKVQVDEITRRSVFELIELLSRTPAARYLRKGQPASNSHLEPNEAVEAKPYSARTIAQHVTYLAALWDMVKADTQELASLENPFHAQELPKSAPGEVLGLTKAQVENLFRTPTFSIGARPAGCYGETCYWIPLLLLWTGARPTEIAELMVSDVLLGFLTEGPTLRFRNSGGRKKRQTKMRQGQRPELYRLIPIHTELLNLGFVDYVSWVKDLGHHHLFPELAARTFRREPYAGFGLWWNGYLKRHGCYPSGRRPATALRSHWLTTARRCGLGAEAIDYVFGRGTQCTKNTILSEVTRGEIECLEFASYNLADIRRWRAPSAQSEH